MAFPLTAYNKTLTGIVAGQQVNASHQTINYGDIEACVDSFYNAIDDLQKFQDVYESVDGIRRLTTSSFVGGTNQLNIAANAVVIWDSSADAEVSGWGSKTLTGLTSSNSFYIWATYVSGSPNYEATNITSAVPSSLSQKYLVGIAVVDGAGAVTFTSTLSTALQNVANHWKEEQTFLNGINVKGALYALPTNYHDVNLRYYSTTSFFILAGSRCRSSDDTTDVVFASKYPVCTYYKTPDYTRGGLEAVELANTTYYLYVGLDSSARPIAWLDTADLSTGGTPTNPASYSAGRRQILDNNTNNVFSIYNDASGFVNCAMTGAILRRKVNPWPNQH